jgi:hypothetical protein
MVERSDAELVGMGDCWDNSSVGWVFSNDGYHGKP